MLAGALLVMGAWVFVEANIKYVFYATIPAAILVPVFYSWWLWRQEQVKEMAE